MYVVGSHTQSPIRCMLSCLSTVYHPCYVVMHQLSCECRSDLSWLLLKEYGIHFAQRHSMRKRTNLNTCCHTQTVGWRQGLNSSPSTCTLRFFPKHMVMEREENGKQFLDSSDHVSMHWPGLCKNFSRRHFITLFVFISYDTVLHTSKTHNRIRVSSDYTQFSKNKHVCTLTRFSLNKASNFFK